MKKTIIATLATAGMTLGALAQGSITGINIINTQVTTADAANSTSASGATSWLTGDISLEIFYASSTTVSQTQINAINALNGVSGLGALSLIDSDGFVLAGDPSLTSTTPGAISGYINDGQFDFSTGAFGLSGAPAGGTAANSWLVFYIVGTGQYANYSGALAFANATGGNPNSSPTPGQPSGITGLDLIGADQGLNLSLSAVPEPGTMALAGLGGLSLFLFRRKK